MKNYIKDNRITLYFNETPYQERFTILNKNTKKAQNFIKRFKKSTDSSIFHCYTKPSDRKQFIFYYWERRAREFNTFVKILGYNCNFFTVAFQTEIECQTYLFIATPSYNYAIAL